MSSLIISVSGLRGIVGESLTPQVAMNYAAAYSALAGPGAFVITRDGRAGGVMLADAIHAALNAAGRPTIDAGVAATPTTGVLIRQHQAAGGIQISASHNPAQYNGMKLFSDEGRVIPQAPGEKVKERYQAQSAKCKAQSDTLNAGVLDATSNSALCALRSALDDTISAHLAAVLKTVDVDAVRAKKYRVLLDANRGAGGLLGRKLLEELGCDVTILGETPDGQFEHTPEPTEENLQPVFEKVRDAGADIAFCQDPDADRLAVIDASGRYLGEEYTVALCLDHVLQTREKGAVVINCASSRMSQDIAEKYGVEIFRSAVGEANVVDRMKVKNAVFGGEGNGGPIDPRVGYVRDSFVGMAQLLDAMAARGKTIAELAAELPGYAIVKRKIPLALDRVPAAIAALETHYAHLPRDRQDGLRIDWPNAWLLVRASNTEPIVRAIAEAETESAANALCDEAESVIANTET
ncbi:MAG: phosphoglucosamine mutase [Planctomycetaceae bacterium]|nr:phosphoglucosamine mutase [Planctomycetaceae bacterium]